MFVCGDDLDACGLCIGAKVASSCEVGIHAHDAGERLGKRQGEESNARVKVQGERALRAIEDSLEKVIDEKTVHLEKREMTHTEREAACLVDQVAGTAEL